MCYLGGVEGLGTHHPAVCGVCTMPSFAMPLTRTHSAMHYCHIGLSRGWVRLYIGDPEGGHILPDHLQEHKRSFQFIPSCPIAMLLLTALPPRHDGLLKKTSTLGF